MGKVAFLANITVAASSVLTLSLAQPALAQTLTKPEDVGMSSAALALIGDALKVNIATGQIPGGVVLVSRNGKVVHFEAQGVTGAGSKTPLRTDTIMAVASLSKPVTAAAVLMLVDEGKISLDDPVSKYIPEFGGQREVRALKPGSPPPPYTPLPFVIPPSAEWGPVQYEMVPARNLVTVRTLLNHTSGVQIFGISNDLANAKPGETLADVVPKWGKAPLEFDPGTKWAYSNGNGFEVLGRIVEVASGQNFRQFLKTRLFAPLGMNDTDFGVSEASAARAVGMFPGMKAPTPEGTTYFSGAAGLWSSVSDYSHFAQMLGDGGTYGGKRLLKAETVKMMTSNQIGPLAMSGYPPMAMPPEGLRFGLGVVNVAIPAGSGTRLPAGSFGWDGVGTRRWWALPQEHVVIVSMVPLIGPAAAPLQRVIEAAVMESLPAPPPPPPRPPGPPRQ